MTETGVGKLAAQLRHLADRESASGPALRSLVDDCTDLLNIAQALVEHLETLEAAADDYDNAEEGRDGAEDRALAWEDAQQAAEEAATTLEELIA